MEATVPTDKLATLDLVVDVNMYAHIQIGNLYDGYQIKFTEPFEISYFIFKNGDVIKITNNLPTMVIYPDIDALFKTLGVSFEDIVIMIHSHPYPSKFSPADTRFYYALKARGFKGSYLLYIAPTKKVYELKEKRK